MKLNRFFQHILLGSAIFTSIVSIQIPSSIACGKSHPVAQVTSPDVQIKNEDEKKEPFVEPLKINPIRKGHRIYKSFHELSMWNSSNSLGGSNWDIRMLARLEQKSEAARRVTLEGDVYLGSEEGLFWIGEGNVQTQIFLNPVKKEPQITSLAVLKEKKKILVGTMRDGVFILDSQRNVLSHLTTHDGIRSNEISKIVPIYSFGEDYFLLATSGGLSYTMNGGLNFVHFFVGKPGSPSNGLESNGINDVAYDNKKLYIATDSGLSSIDLQSLYFDSVEALESSSSDLQFETTLGNGLLSNKILNVFFTPDLKLVAITNDGLCFSEDQGRTFKSAEQLKIPGAIQEK